MSAPKRDYVDVVYDEQARPITDYPDQLARYLCTRYGLRPGQMLLEPGCGRGEFLRGFIRCGLQGFGVDQSPSARKFCPEATLAIADLEHERFPYHDNTFDVVYSKSLLEHFYYPEKIVMEIYRVLKPGGLVLTLCPDWHFNYRMYPEDYTHRTPFTLVSLRDIHVIHGFEDVQVERFRQLPVLWKHPALLPLCELTRVLVPAAIKHRIKWVRFSKEIMALSSARKPLAGAAS